MKKLTKSFKIILLSAVVIAVLLSAWVLIFLVKTEAPALRGEVAYHVPFKQGLTLDIYFPTNVPSDKPSPVLMYIHGGAWITGGKGSVNNNRYNGAFNALRDRGYFVVSPNYTLSRDGQTPFPDCIIDIFDAIQWLNEHAETYQMDLNNFGLLGESAGSHLAMMATFSQPQDFGLAYPKMLPNYLIDVYGPSDMEALYHASSTDSIQKLIKKLPASLAEQLDLSRILVGFDPKSNTTKAKSVMQQLSPINYLTQTAPPTLIIHGKKDQIVPIEQSMLLAKELDSLGINYETHYLDGVNHGFIGATEQQQDSIQQLILNFVLKHSNL